MFSVHHIIYLNNDADIMNRVASDKMVSKETSLGELQVNFQDANCVPINHPVFMAYVQRKLKSPYDYIMMQVRDITR